MTWFAFYLVITAVQTAAFVFATTRCFRTCKAHKEEADRECKKKSWELQEMTKRARQKYETYDMLIGELRKVLTEFNGTWVDEDAEIVEETT